MALLLGLLLVGLVEMYNRYNVRALVLFVNVAFL